MKGIHQVYGYGQLWMGNTLEHCIITVGYNNLTVIMPKFSDNWSILSIARGCNPYM